MSSTVIFDYKFPNVACQKNGVWFNPEETIAKIVDAAKNANACIQTNRIKNGIRHIEVRCTTEDQKIFLILATSGLFGVDQSTRPF